MLRYICLLWQIYAAVAQDFPTPATTTLPISMFSNLQTSTSRQDLATRRREGEESSSFFDMATSTATTTTPAPTSPFSTTPKLFWILNVRDIFPPLPVVFRQGSLYSGDLDTEAGRISNSEEIYTGTHPSSFWALASDYRRKKVYYTDFRSNYFGSYDVQTTQHQRLFEGLSFGIDGIAVDWLTGNVYWIDIELLKIVVADPTLNYFTHITNINSDIPAKIAVNPLQNVLFWSEKRVNSSRIYRSDLSGKNATLLFEFFDVFQIDTLTIDVDENRLYWSAREQLASGVRASVNSIDIDDPRRRVSTYYRAMNGTIQGLASSGDFLFISNSRNRSLISYSKTQATTISLSQFRSTVTPVAMTIFSAEAQPFTIEDHEAHPCSNHTCEQICLTDGLDQHRCACQIGSILQPDGRSCASEILTENFVLVVDDKHSKIYQLSLNDESHYSVLPISDLNTPLSVDYDYETQKIYWYDLNDRKVFRSHLNGTEKEIFLDDLQATSIAIEPESRNLYIVNNAVDSIEVASLELPNVISILHVSDIHSAWQMAISHSLKKIYWTDWGQSTTDSRNLGLIESINMDGTGRTVVVGNTKSPRALTIDEDSQILYWTELGTSQIGWLNLNTNVRGEATIDIPLLPDISKRLNGLEFYRGFLYVADLNRPTIFRVRVSDVLTAGVNSSVTAIPFGPSFFTVTGIKVVFDSAPSSSGTSACADDRDGCPEVCLATPNGGTSCVCQPSSIFTLGNRTCSAVLDTEDVTPPSFGDTCIYEGFAVFLRTDRCSTRRIFNFSAPVATDNSGFVRVKRRYATPPPYNLTEGVYVFTYTASDQSGNIAFCSINTIVQAPVRCTGSPPIPENGEAVSATCGNLFGSEVNVHCFGSRSPTFTFTCNSRGRWQSDLPPICPTVSPITTSIPTTEGQTQRSSPSSAVSSPSISSASSAVSSPSISSASSAVSSPSISSASSAVSNPSSSLTPSASSSLPPSIGGPKAPSTGGSNGGLSSGAVAAIVIVLLVVLLVGAVLFIRRYRQSWLSGAVLWRRRDDNVELTRDFDGEAHVYNKF